MQEKKSLKNKNEAKAKAEIEAKAKAEAKAEDPGTKRVQRSLPKSLRI